MDHLKPFKYYAFISYKSEDVEWAIWLQHELEHYHLPASYNGRTDVRHELRPVFRDIDELSAGNLPRQIQYALQDSQNLIVICSPQAAKSPWVNQEIETFKSLGRVNRIFPFIIDGKCPVEYFPPALLDLPKKEERLGGDVSKNGRDAAFIKVVAGMLGLGFDSLWNRYEKEKAEKERRNREQRYNLLKLKSRFLAEKADELIKKGDSHKACKLMLEVLPTDAEPDVPVTSEAEMILRKVRVHKSAIMHGHLELVYSVNFSPDGKLIVSAAADKTIRLWDINDCKQIANPIIGHTDAVKYASFSPNGKLIVSLSFDRTVRIWDAATGMQLGDPIVVEKEVIEEIRPDNDSSTDFINHFPSIFDDPWDYYNIEEEPQYETKVVIKRSMFNSVSFSPDCKRLVTTNDNEIRIWEVETHKQIGLPLLGHKATVNSAVYDSSGNFIVSASDDKVIILWDARTGCQMGQPLVGHKDGVYSAEFSPNGKRIVSTSRDSSIRIWDVITRRHIKTWRTILADNASYLYNGHYIFASEAFAFYLIDTKSGKKCKYNAGSKIAISKDGLHVVSTDSKNIRLDATIFANYGFKLIKDISCKSFYYAVYSHNGRSIITISSDKLIKIWDAKTIKLIKKFRSKNPWGRQLAISPDDRRLLVSSGGCHLDVWDLEQKKIIASFYIEDWLSYFDFSSDGSKVMCISTRGIIRIFDIFSCKLISKPLQAFTECPMPSLSPQLRNCSDGTQFLSYAYDEEIKIWDSTTYKLIGEPLPGMSANYSPDGKYLVCADWSTASILDTSTRTLIRSYNMPPACGPIENVAIGPFNKYLMAVTDNGFVIWDIATGIVVYNRCSGENLISVSFSPDGKNILLTNETGRVLIWEFPELSHLIVEIRERFKDNPLTLEERKQYYLD